MEIIEFDYETDTYFDEEELTYQGMKFFEDGRGMTIETVIDFIVKFYDLTGLKGAETGAEAFLKGMELMEEDTLKDLEEDFTIAFQDFYEDEEHITFKEMFEDNLYLDVLEYLDSVYPAKELFSYLELILEANDFYVHNVGYSQWATVLAHNTTDVSYARAVWDGTDFYYIARLDDRGDILDGMGMVYADTVEDLLEYAKDIAMTDDFVVVDNDISLYMDVPKVEKVRHVEYTFQEVE